MASDPTERKLVDVLMAHFRAHHHTSREVPHYEKRIDVVAVRHDTDELLAIEAKVAAWDRAISQAVVNLAASEKSYIAICAANAHRVPFSALDQHGIGLISVGTRWGDVKVLYEAQQSKFTNRIAADRIRKHVSRKTTCK